MKKKCPVTTIITTYNDNEYLQQAINSVLAQTLIPEEIIVVDDGSSTNDAENIILTHFQSIPFIKFIKQKNGGASNARNTGIKSATQPYIAFLDVDDTWLPDNLAKKYAALSMCPDNYFGVYGSFINSNSKQVLPFMHCDGVPPLAKIGVPTGFPGGAPSYLFRREALLLCGGFDESLRINEDFDLLLKLFKSGFLCKGDATPGFIRNMREGSLTRNPKARLTHQRVSDFLTKAEQAGYFDKQELARRKKQNDLALVKGLSKLADKSICDIREALASAFKHARPESCKEWLAYFYMILLSIVCFKKP